MTQKKKPSISFWLENPPAKHPAGKQQIMNCLIALLETINFNQYDHENIINIVVHVAQDDTFNILP